MPVGWKTVVLLAIVPLLADPAIAAPRKRPAPARRVPREPAPEPPPPAPVEPQVDKTEKTEKTEKAEKERPPEPPAAATTGGVGPAGGTGSGGAASPDAAARPAEARPEKVDGPDVDNLRQEYLSLRDELFKSRARANAVASQLYSTRIQIKLTYASGRYYNPAKSSIRLDGASVYEDASGAIAGDDGVRFDGYVAPGRHLITFRVEATGKDDDSFTSATESQIVVKAVAGKDLVVAAKARDSGDIAYEWKRSEKGSYGLGIDVAVKTVKSAEAAPAAAKGTKK
jgi:hypothetical protein